MKWAQKKKTIKVCLHFTVQKQIHCLFLFVLFLVVVNLFLGSCVFVCIFIFFGPLLMLWLGVAFRCCVVVWITQTTETATNASCKKTLSLSSIVFFFSSLRLYFGLFRFLLLIALKTPWLLELHTLFTLFFVVVIVVVYVLVLLPLQLLVKVIYI